MGIPVLQVAPTYYVSPTLMKKLKEKCEPVTALGVDTTPEQLLGCRLVVTPMLPYRTGKILQKDPFVTYSERDMDWAAPLGLAEWEMCHAIEVPEVRKDFLPFVLPRGIT